MANPSHRTLARPLLPQPPVVRGLRAFLRRVPWLLLLLCLGFVIQACLVFLVWQLAELAISLLEAWVLIARYSSGA